MRIYIHQLFKKLIKKSSHSFSFSSFLLFFLFLPGCVNTSPPPQIKKGPFKVAQIKIPSGDFLRIKLAINLEEQVRGLSGIRGHQFNKNEGLLFFYLKTNIRKFWMPNTFFPLDIFYLDKKMKVLDIVRNLPFHPGYNEPPPIPRARPVISRHVLEMRSDSPFSKRIKKGDQLEFISQFSLSEIESKIRL